MFTRARDIFRDLVKLPRYQNAADGAPVLLPVWTRSGGQSFALSVDQLAALVSDSPALVPPPTDLSYTASTRLLASSTGADATLPLVTDTDAGLAPATGGGTTNFLRADGTWAAPSAGATDLAYTAATRVLASSTGADATLPLVTSTDAGLAPASGGGSSNFLRADGTWAAPAGGGGASWTAIFKPTDETRNSTTVLADDGALLVALDASSTYAIRITAFLSTSATPDSKYAMAYSGSVASAFFYRGNQAPGAGVGSGNLFTVTTETIPASQDIDGGTGTTIIIIEGIVNTTTAGTLSFQWAQRVSNAANTIVRAGSYLEYCKV